VDAEQQALKRQDSWICFMQTEPQALLPFLMQKAAEWKQKQNQKPQTDQHQDPNYMPLRCYLTQHLRKTFLARLHKLAQCNETDPLRVVALQHGLLTPENAFPFQKWNPQT
jgi:hypothetical protein